MPGPGTVDLDSLTRVAQDYLKVIWSATEWGEPPITTKALAARFGTSAANVTETMRRLATQGLVEYAPYKPVRLTVAGAACAVAMVRRHRLLETFLVTVLGYGWDEVHEDAERLEHDVSDLLLARIDATLGHPTVDPHGDPIPDAVGHTLRPADALTLAEVRSPGRYRVHRVSDADPLILAVAAELGVTPAVVVEVDVVPAGAGAVPLVSTDRGRTPVPDQLAAAVWVSAVTGAD